MQRDEHARAGREPPSGGVCGGRDSRRSGRGERRDGLRVDGRGGGEGEAGIVRASGNHYKS